MLRELNENEMMMVSGGNHEEGHDEVVSTGTRNTNPGVTMEYLNSIGMTIEEYLYGSDYNVVTDAGWTISGPVECASTECHGANETYVDTSDTNTPVDDNPDNTSVDIPTYDSNDLSDPSTRIHMA